MKVVVVRDGARRVVDAPDNVGAALVLSRWWCRNAPRGQKRVAYSRGGWIRDHYRRRDGVDWNEPHPVFDYVTTVTVAGRRTARRR